MQNLLPTTILHRFNEKDPKVFQYVFDIYSPIIKKFVEKIVADTSEAEDIVAESFYKCWLRTEYFESGEKIFAYLYVTARNTCIDYLKHQKVVKAHEEDVLEQILRTNQQLEDWDWVKLVMLNKVYDAIENLPSRCKDVFKMAYLYEMDNEQIAFQTGFPTKTVSTYKSLALHTLKNIFNPYRDKT